MESTEIAALLEQLEEDIDDLEDSLASVLNSALSSASSKLPLLDKAKLYVLITYAIESILFSYLRLHGVTAREHPVFKELTRVKQYFEKLKAAEVPASERSVLSLDRQAAARFIKAGLAGNSELDSRRAGRQEVETGRSRMKKDILSRTTDFATSSPSPARDSTSTSKQDPENVGTRPSTAHAISKKRKADLVDDSAVTTPSSRTGSDSDLSQSKHRKTRKEKKSRNASKGKGKDEGEEHQSS